MPTWVRALIFANLAFSSVWVPYRLLVARRFLGMDLDVVGRHRRD